MSKMPVAVMFAALAIPVGAEEIRVPPKQIEVVPAQPRPISEPRAGVTPVVTVGASEKYQPNPATAHHDGVSPQSRAHIEALIRELKMR